jgi:signal transduction histidine kinase
VDRANEIADLGKRAREAFDERHHAREITISASRRAIQACAASIRATHRGEFESARSLAAERNLFLKCEGPATLLVQGDSVKIQRILQNLVLNALKATQSGGVRVTWEASESPEANQWALCVQDTGPGLVASELPIKRELKEATEGVREVEDDTAHPPDESLQATAPPTLTSKSAAGAARQPVGEGIGLSIVKRLCELLDASIELQTASGQGTTFRVIFPLRYPA